MADDALPVKPAEWMGSSLADLRAFPDDVKSDVGYVLFLAQRGERHPAMKTLKGFGGAGVQEVKANDPSGTYRVVYTVQFAGTVYVLHAFQKKSKSGKATPKEEMDRVERRLEEARAHYHARHSG